MKRKLFIGSSSEGLAIAEKLRDAISKSCSDWLTIEIWKDKNIFQLNDSFLTSLLKASRKYDYGIFVATKDDYELSRGKLKKAPRDNVIFELGLFMGSLGNTRSFILLEEDNKLLSDYSGVSIPMFSTKDTSTHEKAFEKLIGAIEKTKASFNLKPIPSTALALGYFKNLIKPLAQRMEEEGLSFKLEVHLPHNLKDIRDEINRYKNNNSSKEVKLGKDGGRPVVHMYDDKVDLYWDFPTTLLTLGELMDIFLPSKEVGVDEEKTQWIDLELRNFSNTIQVLADQSLITKGNIEIFYPS